MTIMATRALAADPTTRVIVMISKPPAEKVLTPLFAEFKNIGKPVVVYFIGADPKMIEAQGFVAARNLEDAALQACRLSNKKQYNPEMTDSEIKNSQTKLNCRQPSAWLYSGGTFLR